MGRVSRRPALARSLRAAVCHGWRAVGPRAARRNINPVGVGTFADVDVVPRRVAYVARTGGVVVIEGNTAA